MHEYINFVFSILLFLILVLFWSTFTCGVLIFHSIVITYRVIKLLWNRIKHLIAKILIFGYHKSYKYKSVHQFLTKWVLYFVTIDIFVLYYFFRIRNSFYMGFSIDNPGTLYKIYYFFKKNYYKNKSWLLNYTLFKLQIRKCLKILLKFAVSVTWSMIKILVIFGFFMFGYQLHVFLYLIGASLDVSLFISYYLYKTIVLGSIARKQKFVNFYNEFHPIICLINYLTLKLNNTRYIHFVLFKKKINKAIFFIRYRRKEMWRIFKYEFKNFLHNVCTFFILLFILLLFIFIILFLLWFIEENCHNIPEITNPRFVSIMEYKKHLSGVIYEYLQISNIIKEPFYSCGVTSDFIKKNASKIEHNSSLLKIVKYVKMYIISAFFYVLYICINDIKCRRYGWNFYFRKFRFFK